MPQQSIQLAEDVTLVIERPLSLSPTDEAALIAAALLHGLNDGDSFLAPNKKGMFEFRVGFSVFKIYYQYKAKRVISKLQMYSAAIEYIQSNIHRFDRRLALKAIEVLRKSYKDELYKTRGLR